MKALRKALSVTAIATLLTLVAPATTAGACSGFSYKASERGFAKKINQARKALGKVSLRMDPELSKAARKHTAEMVNADTLYHTPSPALRSRVTNWSWLGENVGVGGTVDSLHIAFMNSPDHKENILWSKFRHVGIGVKVANDRMWVTVLFEAKANPGTTLKMPAC